MSMTSLHSIKSVSVRIHHKLISNFCFHTHPLAKWYYDIRLQGFYIFCVFVLKMTFILTFYLKCTLGVFTTDKCKFTSSHLYFGYIWRFSVLSLSSRQRLVCHVRGRNRDLRCTMNDACMYCLFLFQPGIFMEQKINKDVSVLRIKCHCFSEKWWESHVSLETICVDPPPFTPPTL